MTLHVSITRERSTDSHLQARFRATIHTKPGTRPVFMTASKLGSVTLAKREAERVLGDLEWSEPAPESGWNDDTRLVAAIEWE
jgi:hypothetical protein